MRWKLLIGTSLVAALLGTGGYLAVGYALLAAPPRLAALNGALLAALLGPLAAIIVAGVFVYRRTARRRKLQAGLTMLLVMLLTATALAASLHWPLRHRTAPHLPPPPLSRTN